MTNFGNGKKTELPFSIISRENVKCPTQRCNTVNSLKLHLHAIITELRQNTNTATQNTTVSCPETTEIVQSMNPPSRVWTFPGMKLFVYKPTSQRGTTLFAWLRTTLRRPRWMFSARSQLLLMRQFTLSPRCTCHLFSHSHTQSCKMWIPAPSLPPCRLWLQLPICYVFVKYFYFWERWEHVSQKHRTLGNSPLNLSLDRMRYTSTLYIAPVREAKHTLIYTCASTTSSVHNTATHSRENVKNK